MILSGSKASALYHQKKKPALMRWTQAWRRNAKKLNVEGGAKKKVRRVVKVTRAYVGASLDELNKKRAATKPAAAAATPAAAAAAAAAAPKKSAIVAEQKAKSKAAAAARKATQPKVGAAKPSNKQFAKGR